MKSADELAELFKRFPGIGPRQARRFVFHLLSSPKSYTGRIAALISSLSEDIAICGECMRYFAVDAKKSPACLICRDSARDQSSLAVVARDSDLDAIEKSGTFKGRYFVLGGTVPMLETEPGARVRVAELSALVERRAKTGLSEVILAMNAIPEGDHTADVVRATLEPLRKKHGFSVSVLGRGLSTGTELEYADSDTIANALRNRHDR